MLGEMVRDPGISALIRRCSKGAFSICSVNIFRAARTTVKIPRLMQMELGRPKGDDRKLSAGSIGRDDLEEFGGLSPDQFKIRAYTRRQRSVEEAG